MQAGVPIVPIVFRNALDALPRHALVVRPATVHTVVLPPVSTGGWTSGGLGERIAEIRRRYLETLDQEE
jgi:putative phosphoserine phosphatase / 1-acylglycerol-3-phosphate O-acyltransferase